VFLRSLRTAIGANQTANGDLYTRKASASNKRAFPQSRRTVRSGGSDLAAHSDTASRSQPQDARDKPVFDAHSIT